MNFPLFRVAVLGAALLIPLVARAQDEALDADRPGFTNGSGTVAPGRVIAENGIMRTKPTGAAAATDLPETLLRFGVAPALEAQLQLSSYFSVRGGGSGAGDGLLGLKYKFYQSADGKTRAALAPGFTVPLGNAQFGTPNIDPALNISADRQLGERATLAVNLVLNYVSERGAQGQNAGGGGSGGGGMGGGGMGGGRNFVVTPAASLSYSLSSKLNTYVDGYTSLPQRGASASVLDGGFAYLLDPNVQLDVEAGFGVGGAAPSNFVGAGVSFRF